jgi:hypothetical protein
VITAVENRFGRINALSQPIEWLTDNVLSAEENGLGRQSFSVRQHARAA